MPRKIELGDLWERCQYAFYGGRCTKPVVENGLCEKHVKEKCAGCGRYGVVVTGCDHLGQLVCGANLCKECEGWSDPTKPYGVWGFANHTHRRKPDLPPLKKMTATDIGVVRKALKGDAPAED